MKIVDVLLERCNRFAQKWAKNHCHACGIRFKGAGYGVLGRTYCSRWCAPAVYRQSLAGDPR